MNVRPPLELCAALARSVRGPVLLPGDVRYEEAKILFNAMIDRRPTVIVQCMTPADVARAQRFAQDTGLAGTVRGGGHSVAGALLLWPPDAAPLVLRTYRDFMPVAPDATGGGAFFLTGPAEAFVPPSLAGRLAFGVLIVYAGSMADMRRDCAPLLALDHCGERVESMPYADLQCLLDDPPAIATTGPPSISKPCPTRRSTGSAPVRRRCPCPHRRSARCFHRAAPQAAEQRSSAALAARGVVCPSVRTVAVAQRRRTRHRLGTCGPQRRAPMVDRRRLSQLHRR